MVSKKLKVLFVIRAVEHYIYFRSISESLIERGHNVKLLFDKGASSKDITYLKKLKLKAKLGWAPALSTRLRKIVYHLGDLLSYRRYLIVGGQSVFYEQRWKKYYLFLPFKFFLKLPLTKSLIKSKQFLKLINTITNRYKPDSKFMEDLRAFSPDVVVVSPANMPFYSADKEYLAAAKYLKIPTVVPVFSWDNLTTKGLIWPQPDLLLAWNIDQVKEAWLHHKIPKENTQIIGAPFFDFWFEKRRATPRKEFCKSHNLNYRQPILLYLETSDSLTGDERWLLEGLIEVIPDNLQVIVRPHPFKSYFKNFNNPRVIVLPRIGTWPDSQKSIQLYFDSIYHSAAVIGINTSGFIDAVICDKPIISITVDKYKNTQGKTEHFRHLIENDVIERERLGEFKKSIEKIIMRVDAHKARRQTFVKKFIRPRGLGMSAGEAAALEIEKAARII